MYRRGTRNSMATENTVYEGTPMADYLEDYGIEDWGIEAPSIVRSAEGRRLFSGTTRPLPLLLNEGSELTRQRFKNLVRKALQSRLRDGENQHFLERFRYVIVSSHLLDGAISVHRRNEIGPKDRKRDILFGDEGPWDIIRTTRKYWVGGGGCIIVVVVLLSWQIKHMARVESETVATTTTTNTNNSGLRASTTLVLILCIGIYLFAHSRRRLLRILRAKAIAYASHFVENNNELDAQLMKGVRLIQEVELLSQGYRPDLAHTDGEAAGTGMPVLRAATSSFQHSRITSSVRRTTKSLRSALSATLYLSISSFIHGIKDCAPFCSNLDLERCFDIYELKEDDEFGFLLETCNRVLFVDDITKENYYGIRGANATVYELKYEFRRLHFLRRVFMCCLQCISAPGDCSKEELDAWTAVVDNLQSSSSLLLELARALSRDAFIPFHRDVEQPETFSDVSVNTRSSATESSSHLYDMAVTFEHAEARLHLLNEQDENYEENYELLGNELHRLLEAWEQGRSSCHERNNNCLTSSSIIKPSIPKPYSLDQFEEASIISNGTTLAEDDDNKRSFSPRQVFERQQYGHIRGLSNLSGMTILEGVVEQDIHSKRNPSLSRKERIKIMQKNREIEMEKRSVSQQRQNFVLELGNVLNRRREYYNYDG